MVDSGSSVDKSVTWSHFVVSVDNDGSIVYERMSLESGPAEGSVGISKSKAPVQFENGKEQQSSYEPQDCNFDLYHRAFPATWGAVMEW